MKTDERRWKNADVDQDNLLSKEEYGAFCQPWEYEHMYDTVAQENLEDVDKDKDGRISLQEYLGTENQLAALQPVRPCFKDKPHSLMTSCNLTLFTTDSGPV